MEKFRLLRPDEIECKVKQCTEKGVIILLYKTARTDMDLLDETVGPENWETDYKEIKGNLYCGIGVWNERRACTVWKWDCGIESRDDGEGNQKKGEASDAFKRAGFKWGIGRELYTSPFVFIKAADCNMTTNRNGKPATYDTFSVESIEYDDTRKVSSLVIRNNKTHQAVYRFSAKPSGKATFPPAENIPGPREKPAPIFCSRCKHEVTAHKAGGKEYSPIEIKAQSEKKYGVCLCWNCMVAMKAAAKRNAAEQGEQA